MKHMQMFIFSICMICFFSITPTVHAESRFSNGFRGVAWETHKDQLPDLGLSKKSLGKIYARGPASVLFMEGKGNLQLSIDGIPLLSIFMHFNDQNFIGVDLLFKPEDRDKIVSIISTESGPATSDSKEKTEWTTSNTKIVITDRELMVNIRK